MGINIAAQTFLAFFITYMEENQFFYLTRAMIKPETEESLAVGKV